MPIRLHLDENVDPAIAEQLRRRGIDVTTSQEKGLLSSADTDQLQWASTEGRVLFAHDVDFLKMHAKGVGHAGLVYAKQARYSRGEIIKGLSLLCEVMTIEEMTDRLEYLPK